METITEGRKVGVEDSRGKPRFQTVNDDPSMTVQSDAHLADLRHIMAQFEETGLDSLKEADLQFKDVSEFTDLRDALDQARQAETEFLKLPSKVREVFDHDVAVWLDTAHDEDKRDELVRRGYLKPREAEKNEPPAVEPKGSESGPDASKTVDGGDGGEKPSE